MKTLNQFILENLTEAASRPPRPDEAYNAGFYYDGTIYDWLSHWYNESLLHAMTYGPKLHPDLFQAFEKGREDAAKKYGHNRKRKITDVLKKPKAPRDFTYHTPDTM